MTSTRVAAFVDAGKSLDEAVERVRLAESLGYDSAWVTHIATREPLQVLGHYAHATSGIGLGTGVVPFALRHPALLAMEAATLDEVSGGRLRLGIGVSHKLTIEGWYGLTIDDPVGRIVEVTTILRSLFTTGTSAVMGDHYSSNFSFVRYQARADLPILWAAMGPKMLRAAAEHADGIVLWMCSPSHVRNTIRPAIDQALAEFGRSPEEFEIVAAVPAAVTDDVEGAREAFRTQAFPYLNLPFYRKEIAQAHPEALGSFDERMKSGDVPAAMAAIDADFIGDFAGIGDSDAVRTKLTDYRDAGVTLPAIGVIGKRADGEVEATLETAAPKD